MVPAADPPPLASDSPPPPAGHRPAVADKRLIGLLFPIEQVLAASYDAIISVDGGERILGAYGDTGELLGYTPEELVGQPLGLLIPQEVAHHHSQYVRTFQAEPEAIRAMRKGGIRVVGARRKDGSECPVEIVLAKGMEPDTARPVSIAFLRGIARYTQLNDSLRQAYFQMEHVARESERALTESHEDLLRTRNSLRHLLSSSPAIIYTLDLHRNYAIGFMSDNVERVLGYTHQQIVEDETFWLRHVHPDDLAHVMRNFRKLFEEDRHTSEYRYLHQDGGFRWIRDELRMLRDESGRPSEIIGAMMDITELKEASEKLRALNVELEARVAARTVELEAKNQELETFTYSVSHDLKAPLRGIDGYSRLLLEEHGAALDAEGQRFVHTIRDATVHMGQLIDDLLLYSRLERRPLTVHALDLPELVAQLVAGYALTAQPAEIEVDIAVPSVIAEREALLLVLRNLIDNAIKFSGKVAAPRIEVTAKAQGRRVVIQIRDNGIGFDMQYHEWIFQIFQRLHRMEDYPGTGIGLAIVQKAVERMQGEIWAESTPGQGATFYLELPT